MIRATGITADFGDSDFATFGLATLNAAGAGLEMATNGADGVVGGIGGGGGIFFPGDPVPFAGDWSVGALASGELMFAEGASGSFTKGA